MIKGITEVSKKFNGVILMKDAGKQESLVQGYSDCETAQSLAYDMPFYICSISKMFTAVAINQLVDQGSLSKSDPIAKYLKEYIEEEDITIYHLLTHTSGLPNYIMYTRELNWKQAHTSEAILNIVFSKKRKFKAGDKWSYSNTGYYILALIVEQVSGLSYEEYVERYIFNPLKMEKSGVSHTQGIQGAFPNVRNKQGYVIHPTLLKGAGDIISTADDLYKFGQAFYGCKIISTERFNEMIKPVFEHTKVKYGEGVFVHEHFDELAIGHSGSMPTGYSTQIMIYPNREQVNIVLSNNRVCLNPLVYPDTNGKYIEALLMQKVTGKKISLIKKAYI